jgi:predicted amidohydrolase YtcJ
MEPWLKAGYSIVAHANGDRATQQTLDVFEAILKANPHVNCTGMHRIDHFTVTEPEQIVRAKSLGLASSHTIGHVHYWGETFQNYVLGPERAARIHPLRSGNEAGITISLHSDCPVTDVEPLLYLRTATTRLMYRSEEVLGADECVSLEVALKAITLNPAKQLGIENITGTLEVGKKADMVILDQDPREVAASHLHMLTVAQTWFEGKVTFSAADT